jgi:hypothetical protein
MMPEFPDPYGNHERHDDFENWERVHYANARAWYMTFPEEVQFEAEVRCLEVGGEEFDTFFRIMLGVAWKNQISPLEVFKPKEKAA